MPYEDHHFLKASTLFIFCFKQGRSYYSLSSLLQSPLLLLIGNSPVLQIRFSECITWWGACCYWKWTLWMYWKPQNVIHISQKTMESNLCWFSVVSQSTAPFRNYVSFLWKKLWRMFQAENKINVKDAKQLYAKDLSSQLLFLHLPAVSLQLLQSLGRISTKIRIKGQQLCLPIMEMGSVGN